MGVKQVDIPSIPDITLLDLSQTEKIKLRRWVEADGEVIEEEASELLPEDIVSKLSELTGDLKGRVSVGAELVSSIEFGMKAGSFVSISVSCDSDEENLEKAHDVLAPLAQKLCEEDHVPMSKIRDSFLPPEKRLGLKHPSSTEDQEEPEEKPVKRPRRSGKSSTTSRFRSR